MNTYTEHGWVDERTYCPSDLMALEVEAEEIEPKAMILKIKNLTKKVADLLTKNPSLRDDDAKLITVIWRNQIDVSRLSAIELMDYIASGILKSTESITRARRLVQEKYPELRGVSYLARKSAGQTVRENIKEIKV